MARGLALVLHGQHYLRLPGQDVHAHHLRASVGAGVRCYVVVSRNDVVLGLFNLLQCSECVELATCLPHGLHASFPSWPDVRNGHAQKLRQICASALSARAYRSPLQARPDRKVLPNVSRALPRTSGRLTPSSARRVSAPPLWTSCAPTRSCTRSLCRRRERQHPDSLLALFLSPELVHEGHLDKIGDQIPDAVLDACSAC